MMQTTTSSKASTPQCRKPRGPAAARAMASHWRPGRAAHRPQPAARRLCASGPWRPLPGRAASGAQRLLEVSPNWILDRLFVSRQMRNDDCKTLQGQARLPARLGQFGAASGAPPPVKSTKGGTGQRLLKRPTNSRIAPIWPHKSPLRSASRVLVPKGSCDSLQSSSIVTKGKRAVYWLRRGRTTRIREESTPLQTLPRAKRRRPWSRSPYRRSPRECFADGSDCKQPRSKSGRCRHDSADPG